MGGPNLLHISPSSCHATRCSPVAKSVFRLFFSLVGSWWSNMCSDSMASWISLQVPPRHDGDELTVAENSEGKRRGETLNLWAPIHASFDHSMCTKTRRLEEEEEKYPRRREISFNYLRQPRHGSKVLWLHMCVVRYHEAWSSLSLFYVFVFLRKPAVGCFFVVVDTKTTQTKT